MKKTLVAVAALAASASCFALSKKPILKMIDQTPPIARRGKVFPTGRVGNLGGFCCNDAEVFFY